MIEVEIRIDAGVASPVEIPEGVSLTIKDFDVDSDDPSTLFVNPTCGSWYRQVRFTSEGQFKVTPDPSQSAAAQLETEND